MGYTIKGGWAQTDSGRTYTARAVSDTGRILAVVRVEIPLAEGFDLATYFGKTLSEQEIIKGAHEQAETLAKAATMGK